MALRVEVPREALERLCQHYHVQRLAFFGSVLREDFGPESDVDMLVEFEPGHPPASPLSGCSGISPNCWVSRWTCTLTGASAATSGTRS